MKSGPKRRPPSERFWAMVKVGGPAACWPWQGALKAHGYGTFCLDSYGEDGSIRRGSITAHRFAYQDTHGAVPRELVVDHLCNLPACCNPAHLEAVTQSENLRRKYARTPITHCRQGHKYTPETTYYPPNGQRICKVCRRAYMNARNAQIRAKQSASPP